MLGFGQQNGYVYGDVTDLIQAVKGQKRCRSARGALLGFFRGKLRNLFLTRYQNRNNDRCSYTAGVHIWDARSSHTIPDRGLIATTSTRSFSPGFAV